MRIFLIITVISLNLFSCGGNLEFNDSTFQGIKNGNMFWKASFFSATTDANEILILSGTNDSGTLNLQVPLAEIGTYVLAVDASKQASYKEKSLLFSTQNIGDRGPFNVGDGQIVIDEINTAENTITGTFRFNAFDGTGKLSVNFIEGVFRKVPLNSTSSTK